MRTAISKVALVALLIASVALLYSAKSSAWTVYLMDPKCPDVFNEYTTASTDNGSSSTLTMTYAGHSYWRQVAPKYEINGADSTPTFPSTGDITLVFNNMSAATLTSAPPVEIPGSINGSIDNSTILQTVDDEISKRLNNGVISTGGSSGGSSGSTSAPAGWSPTQVIGGSGTSSSGTSSTGTTGTTGSGGIIVIPSK